MPPALAAAAVAFAAAAALTPLAIAGGRRWKLEDAPGGRKRHGRVVPHTGGMAVAGGLVAGFCAAAALGVYEPSGAALPFVAATAIVFSVGVFDDARGCPVGVKLSAQGAAALLIVAAGNAIEVVSTPFGPLELGAAAGWAVAFLWLVGITNAVNFIDGLDGLAGGGASIIAGSLAVFAVIAGDPVSLANALILGAACAGFLPWNWRPARIFLGDGGSQTIGFVLAWLSLSASLKASTAVAVLVPLMVLAVPAVDALLVVLARLRESPTVGLASRLRRTVQADRLHLHHLLLDVAAPRRVVLALHGLIAAGCLLALIAVFRNSPLLAVVTLLVEVAVVAFLRRPRGRPPADAPPLAAAQVSDAVAVEPWAKQ